MFYLNAPVFSEPLLYQLQADIAKLGGLTQLLQLPAPNPILARQFNLPPNPTTQILIAQLKSSFDPHHVLPGMEGGHDG